MHQSDGAHLLLTLSTGRYGVGIFVNSFQAEYYMLQTYVTGSRRACCYTNVEIQGQSFVWFLFAENASWASRSEFTIFAPTIDDDLC